MPQDGAERADGKISIAVNGDDDERSFAAAPQVMMASTNTLQSADDAPAADAGKFAQEVTTSSSTKSVSPSDGTEMPSLEAASRYPRMASRLLSRASSRVSP